MRIPAHHGSAEIGIFLRRNGCARMMPSNSAMLRGETEGECHFEFGQRRHLAIEPGERVWAKTVGPRKPGAQVPDAQAPHPVYCVAEPGVLEVKPLAKTERRREFRENAQSLFRRAVFPQNPHVEMPIVRRPLSFPVARRGAPGAR